MAKTVLVTQEHLDAARAVCDQYAEDGTFRWRPEGIDVHPMHCILAQAGLPESYEATLDDVGIQLMVAFDEGDLETVRKLLPIRVTGELQED